MAEIYRTGYAVPDGNLESLIARTAEARAGVAEAAELVFVRAQANRRAHVSEDHAFIEHEVGTIDHYIVLNDMRGQAAAMSIEFGRGQWIDEDGNVHPGMEPTHILSDAAKIPGRNRRFNGDRVNFPRRPRGMVRGGR